MRNAQEIETAEREARESAPTLCRDCEYRRTLNETDRANGYHAVYAVCSAIDDPEALCEDILHGGDCPKYSAADIYEEECYADYVRRRKNQLRR